MIKVIIKKIILYILVLIIISSCKKNQTKCEIPAIKYGYIDESNVSLKDSSNSDSKEILKYPYCSKIEILEGTEVNFDTYYSSKKYIKVKYNNTIGWTILGKISPTPICKSTAEIEKTGVPLEFNDIIISDAKKDLVKKLPCMKNLTSILIHDDIIAEAIDKITDLKYLKTVYISHVNEIPKNIDQLKNIKKLFIGEEVNKIPKTIGNLKNLKELEIRFANIEEIPEEIGKLKNLEKLSISVCKNLKTLPKSIGKLKKLKELEIYSNNINELPEEINQMDWLEKFYFYEKNIKDFIVRAKTEDYSKLEFQPEWGKGYIYSEKKIEYKGNFPGHIFPKNKINIYNKPNAERYGYLFNNGDIVYQKENSDETHSLQNDDIELGYAEYYLKYYDIKDHNLLVLYNSIENGKWVKISDLKANGYNIRNWESYLMGRLCCYFISEHSGINLRNGPSLDNQIITLIKDNTQEVFQVQLTGKFKGQWAEADIEKKESADCGSGKTLETYKGWFKYLDDKKYPNIWYNPRGC